MGSTDTDTMGQTKKLAWVEKDVQKVWAKKYSKN